MILAASLPGGDDPTSFPAWGPDDGVGDVLDQTEREEALLSVIFPVVASREHGTLEDQRGGEDVHAALGQHLVTFGFVPFEFENGPSASRGGVGWSCASPSVIAFWMPMLVLMLGWLPVPRALRPRALPFYADMMLT